MVLAYGLQVVPTGEALRRDPMRFFHAIVQPVMLVGAVAMSFIGALGLPGCARAIGECLTEGREAA